MTEKKTTSPKSSKLPYILIFLCLGAFAFYYIQVTYLGKLHETLSSPKIEKTAEKLVTILPSAIEGNIEKKKTHEWGDIVIGYYQGKDISAEITKLISVTEGQAVRANIDKFAVFYKKMGPYNPVGIYMKFQKNSKSILAVQEKVHFSGYFGELIEDFVTVRNISSQSELAEEFAAISDMLKKQQYQKALTGLQAIQAQCKCLDKQIMAEITLQNNLNILINQITKEFDKND